MWCAYLFAVLALIGLPAALKPGGEGIIAWIAQTFLQLVLLSVIIVGQNLSAAASDKRSENTYKDAEAVLHEALQIQAHLVTQDAGVDEAARRPRGHCRWRARCSAGARSGRRHLRLETSRPSSSPPGCACAAGT